MKKILSVVFYLVVVAMLGVIVARLFGIESRIVLSGSMEPLIHTGSVCFVNTNAKYEDVVVGDVVAFSSSAGDVTHRVISIQEKGFETKGDANEASDGISVTEKNFRGKTLFSVPYAGYAIHFIKRPVVFSVIVVIFVAFFIIDYIVSTDDNGSYKRSKKDKSK